MYLGGFIRMTKTEKFLKDNSIEFNDMGSHLGIHKALPFTPKEMNALSKFWSMYIGLDADDNWIINGVTIKVY